MIKLLVLAALVSRHRSAVEHARYTENGIELPLGEGLWAIAAGGWDGQGRARAITPHVAESLGQPIVITNKPGAGGAIGARSLSACA